MNIKDIRTFKSIKMMLERIVQLKNLPLIQIPNIKPYNASEPNFALLAADC